ncbi:MAG: PIG-L family deacetylase [Candidatus Nealsonbacteria bacterium]|nr:PIG-L family deacetylase [Candidatus Nealsonbacteria bacterium]
MIKKPNKILAIGAHPDDLDFSCAGTTAKLTRQGSEIVYLIISDGGKGSHKVKVSASKLAKIRKEEQKRAAKAVGVKEVIFLGLKDGEIENTKLLRKEIVKVIRKTKPDIVFSFDPAINFESPYRSHRDHRLAGEAVFDAIYPASGNESFFPELLRQGYKSHQVKEIWFFGSPKPNKFIDIAKTVGDKIKALSYHQSQIVSLKEVEKRVKDWARSSGKKKGYKYAEAFRVVKFRR